MSVVVGIDPSFTRTGLSVLDTDSRVVVSAQSVKVPDSLKQGKLYTLPSALIASNWLAGSVGSILSNVGDVSAICVEVPVVRSFAGPFLLLIQQALFSVYPVSVPVFLVPPKAINGIALPKRGETKDYVPPSRLSTSRIKKMVVGFVADNFILDQSINHDEASAVVLSYIGGLILSKNYSGSFTTFLKEGSGVEDKVDLTFDFG
jgi:hypothetical protein|nr:MAG TPA: HOLLIDAY JUNCTION RESOLVASE [Caudoviricetes sp.]